LIENFFTNIFGNSANQNTTTLQTTIPYTLNSTTSTNYTTIQSPNCTSVVNIGTYGSGSTDGNCSGFVVNIGTYGTYVNYQNACPSVVNIGTYGTYYNNVTGCSPLVNVGSDAKYYNVNTGSILSTSISTTTILQHYTTTIQPTTTIYNSGSVSCSSFQLTESSASSSTSGSCTWSGGYLTVSDNEGQFTNLIVDVYNSTPSNNAYYLNQSVSDTPSCLTDTKSYYFPVGTYTTYIKTGSNGASCPNSYAYLSLTG